MHNEIATARGRRRARRSITYLAAAGAAVAVLAAPAPVHASLDVGDADGSGAIEQWNGIEASYPAADGPWLAAESGSTSLGTVTLAIRTDGTLEQFGSTVFLDDLPPALEGRAVRSASLFTTTKAGAVRDDGTLVVWGMPAGMLPGTFSPSHLVGGEGEASEGMEVALSGSLAVVRLADGRASLYSNVTGAPELVKDWGTGEVVTDVVDVTTSGAVGFVLRADGSVVRVSVAGDLLQMAAANPQDPIVEIEECFGLRASGQLVKWACDGGTEDSVADYTKYVPQAPGRPVQFVGGGALGSKAAAVRTDEGWVEAWDDSTGATMPVPEAIQGHVSHLGGGAALQAIVSDTPVGEVAVATPSMISGTAQVGSELTGTPATFTGSPDSITVEWRDAETDEVLGDAETYTPTTEDLGRSLVLVTTATKADHDDVVSISEAVGPIAEEAALSTTSVAVTSGTYGKAAKATVTVDAGDADATGSVRVTVDGKSAGSANLSAGKATVTLPKTLKPGKHTVRASYAGSDAVEASTGTATMQVAKGATGKPKVKVAKKPTRKKAGLAKVAVPTAKGLVKAAGKVVVTLKKGKQTKKVKAAVKKGVAKVKLPKLAKGKWAVVARYNGNAYYKPISSKKVVLKVR
ncbi:Ig-like domain repeat protein [Nocardioides sp. BGMRC 2183]|nr:Ig-like domain repeat protein [Nocardioides sp. BGMRC 2183]